MKKTIISLLSTCILLSSCSFRGYTREETRCENHFALGTDYKNYYTDEEDYSSFINTNTSYIDIYYYPNEIGRDFHYHLEYKDGDTIDKWGSYNIDKKTINVDYEDGSQDAFVFATYVSQTIDFNLIGVVKYNDSTYHLIYNGYYIFSARG